MGVPSAPLIGKGPCVHTSRCGPQCSRWLHVWPAATTGAVHPCVRLTVQPHLCAYACENARRWLRRLSSRAAAPASPSSPAASRRTGEQSGRWPVRCRRHRLCACTRARGPAGPLPRRPSGDLSCALSRPSRPHPRPCRRSRALGVPAGSDGPQSGPDQYPLEGTPKRPAEVLLRCRTATDSPSTFRLRVTQRTHVRISRSHQSRSLPVRDMSPSLAYARHVVPDLRTPRFTPRVSRARPYVSDAHLTSAHTPRTSGGPTFRIRRSGQLKMVRDSFSSEATLIYAGQRHL